jgi:hypothetical protein
LGLRRTFRNISPSSENARGPCVQPGAAAFPSRAFVPVSLSEPCEAEVLR